MSLGQGHSEEEEIIIIRTCEHAGCGSTEVEEYERFSLFSRWGTFGLEPLFLCKRHAHIWNSLKK